MSAGDLDQMTERLLSDNLGKIFVASIISHIEIGHLNAAIFRAAWQYTVNNAVLIPRDAKGVINLIQKWPGPSGATSPYLACWFQGRQRPRALRRRRTQEVVHVCKTEYLNARTHAHSRLAGTTTVLPNPAMRSRPFLLWSTVAAAIPHHISADRARDLLGLVHHTRESRADLTLVSFAAGTVASFMRPTALDAGPTSRFFAVSEREWRSRQRQPNSLWMGYTADLSRVRNGGGPYAGLTEAIAPADSTLISNRSREIHLGAVTLPTADDTRRDRAYLHHVRRGKTKRQMRSFLRRSYRVRP